MIKGTKRLIPVLVALLLVLSLLAACGGTKTTTQTQTSIPTVTSATTSTLTTTKTSTTTSISTTTTTTTTTPPAPVRIGILEDTSGVVAAYGNAYVEGQKVAVQMVNDAGGIKSLGGAKIEPVWGAGDSTATAATSEVERLISSEKVVGISGPTATAEILAAIPLFERYKVPQIGGLSDEAQFQKGYRFIFGSTGSFQNMGKQQADFVDWLAKNHGAPMDRIAIASQLPSFAARQQGLVDELTVLGYKDKIVMTESFAITVTDQSPLVLKIKSANPTMVIYQGVASDGVLFHKACNTYDYTPWLVMDDNSYGGTTTRDGLGTDLAKKILLRPNIFGVGNGIAGDLYERIPTLKAFKDLWTKAYPGSKSNYPTVSQGAQRLLILVRAIDNAASRNPEDIANALRKVDIKSGDPYIVFGDNIGGAKMTDSGLISAITVMAEQWKNDLSGPGVIWPASFANATPRIQK